MLAERSSNAKPLRSTLAKTLGFLRDSLKRYPFILYSITCIPLHTKMAGYEEYNHALEHGEDVDVWHISSELSNRMLIVI